MTAASSPDVSKKIKTLVFTTLYPSAVRPGHGIFVENRLRHLVASGHIDARVVAPVPWFPSMLRHSGRWSVLGSTPAKERRENIDIAHPRYFLPPKIGMSSAPLLLALGAYGTLKSLRNQGFDFDLIDAHYYYPDGVAAALLAAWFEKPLVITARGSDLNLLSNYSIPRRWIQWAESRAAASITVSAALRGKLIDLGGSAARTHIVRNGVDLHVFQPMDRDWCRSGLNMEPGRWLLSVGNLVPLKGHMVSIEAMSLLPADIKLAIVGRGGDRDRLLAASQRLGVAERIRFVDPVPQSELPRWYNACDALILCSEREGLPNVSLEALACGTPVIGTAVGGIPEVISSRSTGRLLHDRTPAALAETVLDLMHDLPDRTHTRAAATAFSWTETTQRQLELFHTLVPGKPPCAIS